VPDATYASPSRTADGKVVAVQFRYYKHGGFVAMLQGAHIFFRMHVEGQSIASVAVSRNEIFVPTANALLTFDVRNLNRLQQFPWTSGGLRPPAIRPDGRVYAMASNILYIFPPPRGFRDLRCVSDNES
jgi:hypothetical protein